MNRSACWRSRAGKCGSRARTRSTFLNWVRPNSTSSPTTSRWPRPCSTRPGSSGHAPAVSQRRHRQVVLPEAGAERCPRVAADDHRHHPERDHLQRPGGGRYRPRGVGRQPRVPGPAPVALPRSRPRVRGRAPDRPRPSAGRRVRRGAHGGAPAAETCSPSSAWSPTRRPPATGDCTSTCASRSGGTPPRCGPRRWRWPGSWNDGIPSSSPPTGGRRSEGSGSSSISTRTPPTRPCSGRGSPDPAPAARSRRPSPGTRLPMSSPTTSPSGWCPSGCGRRGDPWAEIGDRPQSLQPLLDLAERDRAAGLHDAPWPPEYPKGADEPTRVAPSRAKKQA